MKKASKIRREQGLNPRQKKFVEEYLVDLNAAKAALRAGYSATWAEKNAYRLRAHEGITEAIDRGRALAAKRCGITADAILEEIRRVAMATMGDFARWDDAGLHLTPSSDLTPEQLSAVLEVKFTTQKYGHTVSLKLHPKLDALDKLARHAGLFERDNDQSKPEINLPMVAVPPPCDSIEAWEAAAQKMLDRKLSRGGDSDDAAASSDRE